MLKNNKLSQKGGTNKTILMIISLLVIAIFFMSNASATEFDNVKSYNEETRIVTITNAFGLGDVIGQAKLNTPQNVRVGLGYQKVAEFDIWAYDDYNDAIKQFTFTDMKKKEKINREFDLKMLTYEDVEVEDYIYNKSNCWNETYDDNTYSNCERILNGSHIEIKEVWTKVTPADLKKNELVTIGIFTEVLEGDYVDWIPTIYGVEVDEWATWTADLNTGLISYWKLEEASGNALDSTSSDNDLSITGAPTREVNGIISDSYSFDGSDDCIYSSDTDFTINYDISVALWFKTSSDGYIISKVSSNSAHQRYAISTVDSGDLRFLFHTGSAALESIQTSGTNYEDGNWHFAGFTRNSTHYSFYVDGDLIGTDSYDGTLYNFVDRYLAFGCFNDDSPQFKAFHGMTLDEVGIWNRTLTSTEMNTQLYNSGDGITWTDSFGTAPSVTLTSPFNASNLTSSSVDFISTVTDDLYVQNVTLYLDGVLNETKTTHINGSYTFSKTIAEGYHNWSILAYDNDSLSNQSDTWFFNYTQPPIYIDLYGQADASTVETPAVNTTCVSYEASGVTQLNLTINGVVNYSITNSTPAENLTISLLQNFAEGNYTWNCSAMNTDTSASSSSRTFEVLYSSPVVTLTSPINAYNSTSSDIDFIFNAADLNGINVVTLYINDILNQTNASGVNGTYNFSGSFGDGDYNWSVAADSILSKTTLSDTRSFSIDTSSPYINLTAPPSVFDYLIEGDTLNLNWTVSDANLDECWHDYYYNESNVFSGIINLSAYFNGIYTDESYINGSFYVDDYINELILVKYDALWNCVSPRFFYTPINISSCTSADGKIQINTTDEEGIFSIICDTGTLLTYDHSGFAACGYESPTEIFINRTVLNCSANTTTFDYIQGNNNITFFASDTYGNIANETRSWTSLIGTFSIDYENPVYEGYENTITATIEGIPETSSLTSAILHYNGGNYSTSITYDSGDYEISATLSAPAVTEDTNYTFGFYLTIDGEVYDPQQNNQTVLNANFGECGEATNDTILTLNLVDEASQESIIGDIEIGGKIRSASSDEIIGTIYVIFNDTSNATLCFSPPSAYDLYYMDAEIRYTSDGYSSELYYLQNADITDDLGNLTLYDLNETASTTFKITYQDSTYNFVEGAIVQLQRKYISEGIYKTVEAPLTSYEGVSVLHIDLDSILYRATVVKDGVVLDEFDNIVFQCQSELTGECEHKLLGEINPGNEEDLDDTRDFHYSEPVLDDDSISVTFSIPSSSPSLVNIVLEQKDQFGNKTLCNKTITSSAGAMSCDYDEVLGESYIDFTIYKDGEAMAKQSYIVRASDYLDWLGNNYIFIFVLLLSLVGMALASPEWIIVNGIITMVISGGLYLARGLDFVVGLGSIVWLVIAAIILISKMAKQEDR